MLVMLVTIRAYYLRMFVVMTCGVRNLMLIQTALRAMLPNDYLVENTRVSGKVYQTTE